MLNHYYKPEGFQILRDFRVRKTYDSLAMKRAVADHEEIEKIREEVQNIKVEPNLIKEINEIEHKEKITLEKTGIMKQIGELVSHPEKNVREELGELIKKLNIYQLEDALNAGSKLT